MGARGICKEIPGPCTELMIVQFQDIVDGTELAFTKYMLNP